MAGAEAAISPSTIAADQLGFFRWGRIAGKVLITTDGGDWAFVTEPEFAQLLAGEITEGHPRFAELQRAGFLRAGLDLDALASRLARRVGHVGRGPELHVVTMSRDAAGQESPSAAAGARVDLDRETAERIVEVALQSRSPSVAFELQAHNGEPLVGTLLGAAGGGLAGAAIGQTMDNEIARNQALVEQRVGRQMASAVTINDVITMTQAGLSDDVIITHIRAHGMAQGVQVSDLITLRNARVSNVVIQTMQQPPHPSGE